MRLRFIRITSIALLTLLSSSVTTGVFPGRSIQVLAQTQDDRKAEADRLFQEALERGEWFRLSTEANRLSQQAAKSLLTSQFQAVLQSSQQLLEIYREIGDRANEGRTLLGIGVVYGKLGQDVQALEYYQQALSIAQAVGDRFGEGLALRYIGSAYNIQEQHAQALEYYQQALSIMREMGDQIGRIGEGSTLSSIGGIYADQGQYAQALDYSTSFVHCSSRE